MTWLLESPVPALIMGAAALGLLGVAYVNTHQAKLLKGMIAAVAATIALLALEAFVVTDREAVSDALDLTAAALVTNDIDQVLACLDPDGDAVRAAAQAFLPQLDVTEAKVGGDLKVTINRLTNPPTATAKFTGRITAKSTSGQNLLPYENIVRRFTLKLKQVDDRWLIHGYEESARDGAN